MKIVAIANQKGGVGKTTTAVNLGAALAEIGHRILIIDLDPQANATSSFGLQAVEQTSLYEPLLGGASITERIFPTEREDLFIVPSDLDLAGAEVEIARMPNHLTRLAETLQPLHADDTFDFVLLDCPPSLGILMTNALAAADELLTPIQCEYFALEGLVKIVRLIEQVRDSGANKRLRRARLSNCDSAQCALERSAQLWEINSGVRSGWSGRRSLPSTRARVHPAPFAACHFSRDNANTVVGKPRNVISFSGVIPIFSATRREGMFSG